MLSRNAKNTSEANDAKAVYAMAAQQGGHGKLASPQWMNSCWLQDCLSILISNEGRNRIIVSSKEDPKMIVPFFVHCGLFYHSSPHGGLPSVQAVRLTLDLKRANRPSTGPQTSMALLEVCNVAPVEHMECVFS